LKTLEDETRDEELQRCGVVADAEQRNK
jgi:hypothetical protein